MKFVLLVIALLLSVYTQSLLAMGPYADISMTRYKVELASGTVRPYSARLKIGYDITKNISGELIYGQALENDDLENQSFDIESVMGYYLRYQSEYHNNVRMYLFAGNTEIETTQIGENPYQFDDTTWGIGAEERLAGRAGMYYVLEYAQFIKQDGDRVTGITFGLRWDLQ